MRRRLACDLHKVERPASGDIADRVAEIEEVMRFWARDAGRVALLGPDAIRALEEVPAADSLSALGPMHTYYIAPSVSGGFGIGFDDGSVLDGFYCITGADVDEPLITDDPDLPITGIRYWPTIFGIHSADAQNIGPSGLTLGNPDGHPGVDRLHRLILASMAAIRNPMWVRSVLPGWEAGERTPSAPRRARKRGDPRAKPYKTVRLSPDARHIVRHKEPVRCGQQPPRRIGRGIVLGTPRVAAEHDVRKHTRRIVTTEERAMERDDWTPVELLPESMVAVLVPVRPHVRGKGPRKAMMVKASG